MKLHYLKTEILEVENPDFNFDLTASAYNFSWFYDGHILKIPFEVEESLVIACVRKVEEKKLEVKYYVQDREKIRSESLQEYVRDILGLDEDLSDFYKRAERDPILREPVRGLHIRRADPWTAFLIAVSQQNASFKQGWYMLYRLYKYLGKQILVEDRIVILPPSPEDVLRHGEKALRDCGYGYRATIVLDVAKHIVELGTKDLHKVLKGVKGVGPYTYGLACAIAYREYNNPVIDRWVQGLYQAVGVRDIKRHYEQVWGPWKAYATWMLTIVFDAVPLSQALQRLKQGLVKPTFKGLTPLTMWKYW